MTKFSFYGVEVHKRAKRTRSIVWLLGKLAGHSGYEVPSGQDGEDSALLPAWVISRSQRRIWFPVSCNNGHFATKKAQRSKRQPHKIATDKEVSIKRKSSLCDLSPIPPPPPRKKKNTGKSQKQIVTHGFAFEPVLSGKKSRKFKPQQIYPHMNKHE